MRSVTLVAVVGLCACGPGRDQSFHQIVQFSAVDKIVAGGKFIYFAETGALKRVGKQNMAIELLLGAGTVDFTATDGHVYAATNAGIVHFTVDSSGAFTNAGTFPAASPPLAVAADASGVSWVSCVALTHSSLDGTSQVVVPLTQPCSGGTRLTLDSSTAYGIDAKGEWWASRSGGAPVTFAARQCSGLQAAGGWVYCSSEKGLARLRPLDGLFEDVLVGEVRAFAIGAVRVYASLDTNLVSSPRNSQNVEVLGTYAAISSMTVDDTSVYLVNTAEDKGLLLSTSL